MAENGAGGEVWRREDGSDRGWTGVEKADASASKARCLPRLTALIESIESGEEESVSAQATGGPSGEPFGSLIISGGARGGFLGAIEGDDAVDDEAW